MNTRTLWIPLMLAGLLAPAQPAIGLDYGALMGSYVIPDSGRNLERGGGAHLVLALPGAVGRSNAEFNVFGHKSDVDGGGSAHAWGAGVDWNYRPEGVTAGQPFLLAGFGVTREEEESSPFVDLGVGFTSPSWYQGSERVRAELRGYVLFDDTLVRGDNHAIDLRLNLGWQISGAESAPAKPAVVLDADQDAIADAGDRCPATPRGQAVDSSGCTDGDADKDGIGDSRDQCPGTPRGQAVDASGCVAIEKFRLSGVSFATGSNRLTTEAQTVLNSVAEALKRQPGVKAEIGGHSDGLGDDAKNLRLSQRRAESVRTYLIEQGVDGARLTAKGYGETQPVDTNDTPAGRANNRRVEFKL